MRMLEHLSPERQEFAARQRETLHVRSRERRTALIVFRGGLAASLCRPVS